MTNTKILEAKRVNALLARLSTIFTPPY